MIWDDVQSHFFDFFLSTTTNKSETGQLMHVTDWILFSFPVSLIGDIILTVNGIIIKGYTHQQIIELIRESVNMLK